ncbi:adenosine deaminase [Rubrivivax gelatinosus]|nr:adenosine deaminase [Rubrivivax gelatinosus]
MACMLPDADAAYLALAARDARFDGRFFVGVTSTGIYCRPVCRVRTPRRENCRFFASPAQAEAAAFRPCLKCRPEIAPGLSAMDSSDALAAAAARAIEAAVQAGEPLALPALAARLGVGERHLRRIFGAAHGVAPRDYLTTQRLLLAKQLLTDTTLPVAQVALASGFESLRRFNAAFAGQYRLAPTRLRRAGGQAPAETALRLAWRPPYDVAAMLGFAARRALAGVEQVEGPVWRRTVCWPWRGQPLDGWIACRFVPERHELHLLAAPALAPVLGALLRRVRETFDLDCDPAPIAAALLEGGLAAAADGTRLPGAFDGFETAVRIVLGQQVTVAAANTLAARLVRRWGRPLATPFPALDRLFPDAATLAAADPDELGRLGLVRQRVRALQALASEVAAGRIRLERGAPLAPTLAALGELPGFGPWTLQLIALRVLGWPDAWPVGDAGLAQALGTRENRKIETAAEAWRPWRAYAAMALWRHGDTR